MKLRKFRLNFSLMKFLFKIILIIIFALSINESRANTLFDSLNSAYLNNPKLNAERASMRASREEKRETISEFLPSVTVSGYVSDQQNTKTAGSDSNFKPAEQSVTVEQKIFQGGSGIANFTKKRHGQTLGEFKLKKVEQEILLDAAKAHTELLLNMKKVNINLMNIDLLERQVETDKNRLENGEISLTDLAQSESSFLGAKAQLIESENNLVAKVGISENLVEKIKNPSEINHLRLGSWLEGIKIGLRSRPPFVPDLESSEFFIEQLSFSFFLIVSYINVDL